MSARDGFESPWLADLECQYCRQPFVIESRWIESRWTPDAASINAGHPPLDTAILHCACHRMPIVAGIVVARRDLAGRFIRIYDECASESEAAARARECLARDLLIPEVFGRGEGTFVETIDALLGGLPKPAREWPIHAQHWYRTTKYLALLPLLEIAANHRVRRILDLGCGAGHVGFQVAHYTEADTIFGVDRELLHLIAARSWILESIAHVCLLCADANEPLPIRRETFDAVVSADALHYIKDKSRAVRELARLRRPGGLTVLSHLHNSLKSSVEMHQGASLEPGSWRLLFDRDLDAGYVMTSDDDLRRAATGDADAWHVTDGALKDLATARSFSLVSGASALQGAWRDSVLRTRGLDADIINPIYDIGDTVGGSASRDDPDRDTVVGLRRRPLSESFEYEFACASPPRMATIDLRRAVDDGVYREELRRHAILVMAPRRYTLVTAMVRAARVRDGQRA